MRAMLAIAAIGLATGAHAACNLDQAGISERYKALVAERGTATLDTLSSLSAIRRTAELLDMNGHDAACDELVDAAFLLLEPEDAWIAKMPEAALGKRNLTSFAANGTPVESRALVGQPLAGADGAVLGLVDGVLLDQGRDASHLIVRHAGPWDAGGEIALPSTRVLTDPATGALFAEISPDSLGDAPVYDRENWDAAANDAWYEAQAAKAVNAAAADALASRTAEQQASDAAMARSPARPMAGPERDVPMVQNGPKRIRVEKDRPDTAQGSSD